VSRVRDFVDQMGEAWEHHWESLRGALAGVTEEEAAWQHEAYRAEEREEGWPPPGTILWQIAHVAHCKRFYTRVLEARGRTRPEAEPRTPVNGLAAEVDALERAHRAQVAGIAALAEGDLERRVPTGMSVREFVAHQVRHDVWHAAQIAVARRLYRTRGQK
jgi:uncharacterized damage-inducible protein DinB